MGGWPSSARYALVRAGSSRPLASRASSFAGTRAAAFGSCLAASSSSSAREVAGTLPRARSGAVNGLQPKAGSRKPSTRTLTSWSGPATSKLRTFGQSRPVPIPPPVATMLAEVPADGTRSRPVRSRGSAAVKNAAPLQDETPLGPLTQRPWASAPEVAPTGVRSMPLAPKSMVTMAPGGSSGMTGALAGLAPLVTIAGV